MFANTPVYYPSIEYAKEKNELELWRGSHNIKQSHAQSESPEQLGGMNHG